MGKKKWISNLYTYCVLVIASVFMVFPFLWLVLSSLKTEVQLFEVPIHILPDPSTFAELQRCNCGREYVYVYEEQSDYCSYYDGDYSCDQHPCGVCLAKIRFRAGTVFFMVILVIRMVPAVTQLLPLFKFYPNFI